MGEWALCPIGRFWVQVLRASADGQRGLDTDPSETGGPCSQGRLRLRPQLRPRRPARPRPRPPARSLPGLGEHSIHSAAGLGRSRSRSQSRAGPGSRRRQRGDAGERGRAGERCASRGPGRPAARAAPPSGLCAATGRPAGRGGRGNGRRGRGGGAGPPPWPPSPGSGGQHRRLPSVGPRAVLDWRVAQPHAWGPPGRPVPRAGSPARRARADCALVGPLPLAGLRNLPCPPQPLRAARSPWLPRPPPPLGPPPPPSQVPAISPAGHRPAGLWVAPLPAACQEAQAGALQSRASCAGDRCPAELPPPWPGPTGAPRWLWAEEALSPGSWLRLLQGLAGLAGRSGDGNKGMETSHSLAGGLPSGPGMLGGGRGKQPQPGGWEFLVAQGKKEVRLLLCNSHRSMRGSQTFPVNTALPKASAPERPLPGHGADSFLPPGGGVSRKGVGGEDQSSRFLSE